MKNINENKNNVDSHLNKVDRLSVSDAKFNEIHYKSIDISKDYICYVCKRIYDLLTDFEVNNNCYLENKNHMPFRRNVCRNITRIALIPFENYVTVICFLYKNGYRTIIYRKSDTIDYHDYIVAKFKKSNLNYGKGSIREITPLD